MEQADIPLPTCQKASSLCNLLRDPFFWNSYKMKSARTGAMTSFRVRWWECHQVDKTCHLPSYELKVEGQQVVKILWNALLEKLFLAMAALTKPRCEGSAFLVMGEKVEVWAIKEGKIEPDLSLPDLTAKLFPFHRSYEKLLGYQVLGPGQNDSGTECKTLPWSCLRKELLGEKADGSSGGEPSRLPWFPENGHEVFCSETKIPDTDVCIPACGKSRACKHHYNHQKNRCIGPVFAFITVKGQMLTWGVECFACQAQCKRDNFRLLKELGQPFTSMVMLSLIFKEETWRQHYKYWCLFMVENLKTFSCVCQRYSFF